MSAWKEKRDSEDQLQKLCSVDSRDDGANRRAIGLMPQAPRQDRHEITLSANLRYRQLLLSLEAKQSTCCLRIISPSKKSRSAILIYCGQVIGCVYGNKRLEHQIFGETAHQNAISDLAQPDSIVDAYVLTEEIVLAAASMFHGNVMRAPAKKLAHELYDHAVTSMLASNSVGCIVISDKEGIALCMIYIFAGRIVGAYSFAQGWLEPTFESGLECLHANQGATVMASALNARNESDARQLCFSLTGLIEGPSDRNQQRERGRLGDFAMHTSSSAEQYRTELQLTHIELKNSPSQGKNFQRPPIINNLPTLYSIDPALF